MSFYKPGTVVWAKAANSSWWPAEVLPLVADEQLRHSSEEYPKPPVVRLIPILMPHAEGGYVEEASLFPIHRVAPFGRYFDRIIESVLKTGETSFQRVRSFSQYRRIGGGITCQEQEELERLGFMKKLGEMEKTDDLSKADGIRCETGFTLALRSVCIRVMRHQWDDLGFMAESKYLTPFCTFPISPGDIDMDTKEQKYLVKPDKVHRIASPVLEKLRNEESPVPPEDFSGALIILRSLGITKIIPAELTWVNSSVWFGFEEVNRLAQMITQCKNLIEEANRQFMNSGKISIYVENRMQFEEFTLAKRLDSFSEAVVEIQSAVDHILLQSLFIFYRDYTIQGSALSTHHQILKSKLRASLISLSTQYISSRIPLQNVEEITCEDLKILNQLSFKLKKPQPLSQNFGLPASTSRFSERNLEGNSEMLGKRSHLMSHSPKKPHNDIALSNPHEQGTALKYLVTPNKFDPTPVLTPQQHNPFLIDPIIPTEPIKRETSQPSTIRKPSPERSVPKKPIFSKAASLLATLQPQVFKPNQPTSFGMKQNLKVERISNLKSQGKPNKGSQPHLKPNLPKRGTARQVLPPKGVVAPKNRFANKQQPSVPLKHQGAKHKQTQAVKQNQKPKVAASKPAVQTPKPSGVTPAKPEQAITTQAEPPVFEAQPAPIAILNQPASQNPNEPSSPVFSAVSASPQKQPQPENLPIGPEMPLSSGIEVRNKSPDEPNSNTKSKDKDRDRSNNKSADKSNNKPVDKSNDNSNTKSNNNNNSRNKNRSADRSRPTHTIMYSVPPGADVPGEDRNRTERLDSLFVPPDDAVSLKPLSDPEPRVSPFDSIAKSDLAADPAFVGGGLVGREDWEKKEKAPEIEQMVVEGEKMAVEVPEAPAMILEAVEVQANLGDEGDKPEVLEDDVVIVNTTEPLVDLHTSPIKSVQPLRQETTIKLRSRKSSEPTQPLTIVTRKMARTLSSKLAEVQPEIDSPHKPSAQNLLVKAPSQIQDDQDSVVQVDSMPVLPLNSDEPSLELVTSLSSDQNDNKPKIEKSKAVGNAQQLDSESIKIIEELTVLTPESNFTKKEALELSKIRKKVCRKIYQELVERIPQYKTSARSIALGLELSIQQRTERTLTEKMRSKQKVASDEMDRQYLLHTKEMLVLIKKTKNESLWTKIKALLEENSL